MPRGRRPRARALCAPVLPRLCLGEVLSAAGELEPAGAFPAPNKAPKALLRLLPWQPFRRGPKACLSVARGSSFGDHCSSPGMALSCLPLEHNAALYLKLQENPVRLILWERPENPPKSSGLLKNLC